MKTRRDVKTELAELTASIERSGLGVAPLVCGMRRMGENGETRSPGLYRESGYHVIVYEREDGPTAEELREYFPRGGLPLLVGGEANPSNL